MCTSCPGDEYPLTDQFKLNIKGIVKDIVSNVPEVSDITRQPTARRSNMQKNIIRHTKVTEMVEKYSTLRLQRSEKDDIHEFTRIFVAAAVAYGELNEAERIEFRKTAIARC